MLRKLIIAGAALAALATPALAEQWYLVHPLSPAGAGCQVLNHRAQAGEEEIAGPFASQASAQAAMDKYAACVVTPY